MSSKLWEVQSGIAKLFLQAIYNLRYKVVTATLLSVGFNAKKLKLECAISLVILVESKF